jgi:Nanos RNA binding domain
MSRSTNFQIRTPCCKVCKDAGKSVKEYESHWPKDREGKTICPTLLSQECRYCHKLGHTTKYCSALIADERAKNYRLQQQQRGAAPKKEKKSATGLSGGSIYSAAFGSDDEDDEDPYPAATQKKSVQFQSDITLTPNKFKKDEFPALAPAPAAQQIATGHSYAAVALMPPTEKKAPAAAVTSGTRITIADIITHQKASAATDYEEEWENKRHFIKQAVGVSAKKKEWYDDSDDEEDADDAAEYLAAIHAKDW